MSASWLSPSFDRLPQWERTSPQSYQLCAGCMVWCIQLPCARCGPRSLTLLAVLRTVYPALQTQMRKGFNRVAAEMDDIRLDHPKAPQLLSTYKDQAFQEGWLTSAEEEPPSAEA